MNAEARTVSEAVERADGAAVTICDVSPPRGARAGSLADAARVRADFLCAAHSPGRSVRLGAATAAGILVQRFGRRAAFNLATRDMNRIAVQSALLDAAAMGVDNVAALRGDPLSERDSRQVSAVNDYTTTALLRDIGEMNRGRDFRGRRLDAPTAFCAGATADLSNPIGREAALTARKAKAGAEFILCQAAFDPARTLDFQRRLMERLAPETAAPNLFAGVQIPSADGTIFGDASGRALAELRAGRSGLDMAMENAAALMDAGFNLFYIIPPILPKGERDYEAADRLIEWIRGRDDISRSRASQQRPQPSGFPPSGE